MLGPDFTRKTINRPVGPLLFSAALAALIFCGSPSAYAVVVTDDFTDGNDTANPAWTHLDGLVSSTGQTWDASTGQYAMFAPSNGFDSIGFVGSSVGPSFEDVRVSMDLVDLHTTFNGGPPGPSFVQIMARSNAGSAGSNGFLGLTGYAYGYDPVANAGGGEMVLYRNDVNDPVKDIGSQRAHLDENKDYRFVLEIVGNVIHGQVFNLTDGGVLTAELFNNIATATNVYASGTSGVFGYTEMPFDTQFTIDNFRAETIVPGDYNENGSTDAGDYILWRKTVGQQSPQLAPLSFEVIGLGNMQANGAVSGACGYNTPNCEVINDADYAVWRANFGNSVSGAGTSLGSAVVPEPASVVLIVVGLSSLLFARGRSSR
jgi:hypothetical protein